MTRPMWFQLYVLRDRGFMKNALERAWAAGAGSYLDPEDAREAVRFGADGIVVSNHGGRQLDGLLSSARALPAIADAVQGDLTSWRILASAPAWTWCGCSPWASTACCSDAPSSTPSPPPASRAWPMCWT